MNILSHLRLFRKRYLIALLALIFAGTVYVSADMLLNKYKNPEGLSKQNILTMVGENRPNRENCQIIFNTDLTQYHDDTGNIRKSVYDYHQVCDQMFNIAFADLNLDFCTRVIAGTAKDFAHRYLKLGDFSKVQDACVEKFLSISFATGSLFDPENGFKSTVKVDF